MSKSKYMDRPTKKYIRNKDLKKFNKNEYGMYKGAALSKYYGTLKKAYDKGVPVYNSKGKLTHKPKNI